MTSSLGGPEIPEVQIRGSVRVLCEIRNLEAQYGETPFSADRSMLAHWASLIEAEFADHIAERLPELRARVAASDAAKKIRPELLNAQVTI